MMRSVRIASYSLFALLFLLSVPIKGVAQQGPDLIIKDTLVVEGVEREYYVYLPQDFDKEKLYWLLVSVHGGGGNGQTFFLSRGIRDQADTLGLDAIVVSPSFSNTDFLASRFPVLGEGYFLKQVLQKLRRNYIFHERILLSGYSRGGQFSHRFALQNPDYIEACAPFAAGTWTTPDGRLLIDSFGEVREPEAYLSSQENALKVPQRLQNLFTSRVAKVAGIKAQPGANRIPFLIMNGTLDTRLPIAEEFARSLENAGYMVEVEWPETPHNPNEEGYEKEFGKYSRRAVEFFLKVVGN